MKIDHIERRRAGIYALVNRENQHKYVGQSKDLRERLKNHMMDLRGKRHVNRYLQHAFNLHGERNFVAVVLEYVPNYAELDGREQFWIEKLKPEYNAIMDVIEARDHFNPIVQAREREFDDPVYIREGESFERPAWHAWVYGGSRNPQRGGGG